MFRAIIRDGSIDFSSPAAASRFNEWKRDHEGAVVLIEEEKAARTLSELRMYRAWLNGVADHSGNDPDELHEWLIDRCAPTVVTTIKGPKGSIEVERKKRTSGGHSLTMDKHEMADFMQKCAMLTGYPLPTPEELSDMGYVTKGADTKIEYPKEDGNIADKF